MNPKRRTEMRHGNEESEEMFSLVVVDDPHWKGAVRKLAIERRTQENVCRVPFGCMDLSPQEEE
jgi:hypothetical protein